MNIEFLGHAGFCITTKNIQILVDPWLIPSTAKDPILNCFVPDHKTIDYLIPEATRRVEDLRPDFIMVSHYHTHHSPKNEIEYWLKNSEKKITVIGPDIHSTQKVSFLNSFSKNYPQHDFHVIDKDTEMNFNGVILSMKTHTVPFHLSFLIQSENKKFLHIADSVISRVWFDRRLDPIWFKYKNLNPDYLALTVGHTSSRRKSDAKGSFIRENSFLSPVEGALLTKLIAPKSVSVIGIYNCSIWKDRTEFGYPYAEVENYFRWAVHHLTPEIKINIARPGNQYRVDVDQLISL